MNKIDVKQVVLLHELLINQIGGRHGIKDYGVLESSVLSIYQTFDGQELYPSVEEKSARLGYNLVINHAFVDGNKRVGILAMLTLLEINDIKINYTDKDIIALGFAIATGKSKFDDVINWINSHKIKNSESNIEK